VPEQPTSVAPHLTPDPAATLEQSAATEPAKTSWRVFAVDISPLRDSREYSLLFIAQSVSFFGSMMSFVALPWQLFQLTKSSFAVGLLGVAEFIAIFSMAFIGGALADYIDRRRMVRLTEMALALGSVLLIVNSLLARPQAWVLFVAASLFAALNGLQRPALDSSCRGWCALNRCPPSPRFKVCASSIAMIGGPALGGILVVSVGPRWLIQSTWCLPHFRLGAHVDAVGATAARCRAAEFPFGDRRIALCPQPAGIAGHLPHRFERNVLWHADGLVPGDRGKLRWRLCRFALRQSRRRSIPGFADFRLVRESASPRAGGRAGGRRLGISDPSASASPAVCGWHCFVSQWREAPTCSAVSFA
jgi:MFS family permease